MQNSSPRAQRPASSHASRSSTQTQAQGTGGAALPLAPASPASKLVRPQTAPLSPSSNGDAAIAALPRCRQARAVPQEAVIHNLPALLTTPPGLARKALFAKKLRLCCHWLEMGPAAAARHARLPAAAAEAEARLRETKRLTLLEIVNYYTLARPLWSAEELGAVFDMIACNLFRALPASSFETHQYSGMVPGGAGGGVGGYTFSPEEDQQSEDLNWAHVQIAYELLLRMVSFIPSAQSHAAIVANANDGPTKENPHPEAVPSLAQLQASHKLLYSTFLSRRFLLSLLSNFASEDSRERDYLKTIIHRIYGQSMSLRPFIRRNIQYILVRALESAADGTFEHTHGVSELLEILGSIINGFAVPLKASHVQVLFRRVLLPLHKMSHLALFHPQLSYACMQFLEKDVSLSAEMIVALLSMWPRRNSKKEVLFLNELDEILERLPLQRIMSPRAQIGMEPPAVPGMLPLPVMRALLTRFGSCLSSLHFQVSEKAIYMLSESMLRKLIYFDDQTTQDGADKDHRKELMPIVARAIYINTELPILNSLTSQQPVHHASSSAAAAAASAAAVAAKVRASSASGSASSSSSGAPARSPQTSPRSSSDPSQADTPRGAPESELGVLAAPASGSSSAGPASPSKGHWNATITDLTSDISATLARLDGALWSAVHQQLSTELGSLARLATANSQHVRAQLLKTQTHLREAKLAVRNSAVY